MSRPAEIPCRDPAPHVFASLSNGPLHVHATRVAWRTGDAAVKETSGTLGRPEAAPHPSGARVQSYLTIQGVICRSVGDRVEGVGFFNRWGMTKTHRVDPEGPTGVDRRIASATQPESPKVSPVPIAKSTRSYDLVISGWLIGLDWGWLRNPGGQCTQVVCSRLKVSKYIGPNGRVGNLVHLVPVFIGSDGHIPCLTVCTKDDASKFRYALCILH